MLTILSCGFALLPLILAQTTACPACDTLLSLWDPDQNSGSCLGDPSNPINYIVNFEQCLCGSQGQSDYSDCAACNLDGDGGIPIDGLNFGPASGFQSACSKFAADVTSILEPSGLIAFVDVVAPMQSESPLVDILGYYIVQNFITLSMTGLVTDTGVVSFAATSLVSPTAIMHSATATSPAATASPTGGTAAPKVNPSGTHSSESRKNSVGIKSVFSILALAISVSLLL